MLAVLAADGARLDAGSVGLGMARRWCDAGESVLFVDADVSGSRLAQRLSAAERAEYSPAARGLPSLVVAREPLTLKSLAAHCYSLHDGALWALFAPFHPAGGQHTAAWLASRVGDLQALDRQRTVVLSSSLRSGGSLLGPLLEAAAVVVVLAPVESLEQAKALWTSCRDAGLMDFERRGRVLVVEGGSPLDDDEIGAEAGMHVAGRLPLVEDERVLRLQGGRRDRVFARRLDKIAGRVLALSHLGEGAELPETAPFEEGEPSAARELATSLGPPPLLSANGSEASQEEPEEDQTPEALSEGRV